MKKSTQKKKPAARKHTGKLILLIVLTVLLVILVAFALSIRESDPAEHQPGTSAVDPQPTVLQETIPIEQANTKEFQEIDLGKGLYLTGLAGATGQFPEDGSDEFVQDILSATFRNDSDKTLQYAKVNLTIAEVVYTFEFSTVPAGKTVRAFEMSRAAAPETVDAVLAAAEYISFFQEEPTCYEGQLQITVGDGVISVKNISEADIDQEISVFYKNVYSDVYMGGITYRVRISGLKAGEEISGYASHAGESATQIMFVTYGN